MEVLFPSNPGHDRRRKFEVYAEAGVPEYWMADPDDETLEVWVLRGSAYAHLGTVKVGETGRSELLPDLAILVARLFV